jgi:mycothiol system anti-sigma-R factor
MSCKDIQPLIHGYLDGELDLVRSLEVEQHMKDCPVCTRAYNNHQALRSAIANASLYSDAPANLRKRVRSAVRQASKQEARVPWFSWRWLAVGAPLVGAAAVLVISLVPVFTRPSAEPFLTQEVISGHVRSLMADHLTDVASSDQHTVKPWFNGKLDFSPQVKDLTNQGFPLVGGRLDYLGNRSVAALVYQRGKHAINLFIWPSTNAAATSNTAVTRNGYHVVHWVNSGMSFWAVSDLNEKELLELTEMLRND